MGKLYKKKFIIEICVDKKNIDRKYPNFWCNWGEYISERSREITNKSANAFISHLIGSFEFVCETDMKKNGLKEWGYSIKIRKSKVR